MTRTVISLFSSLSHLRYHRVSDRKEAFTKLLHGRTLAYFCLVEHWPKKYFTQKRLVDIQLAYFLSL